MRIRSIKPEFWESDDISALSIEDRFLFIGMWSYVDDNGVGLDKLARIAADLFADDLSRDPQETYARVSRGLQHLAEASRIVRYSVGGRDLLYVTNWEKHQRIDRPNKARYPLPTCGNTDSRDILATPSRDLQQPAENDASGTGEQGNRGTGEQGNRGTGEQGKPAAAKRPAATPLPEDFDLTPERIEWARTNAPAVNARLTTDEFTDYWRDNQKRKTNWETTWRNWLRRKQQDAEARGWRPPTSTKDLTNPENW